VLQLLTPLRQACSSGQSHLEEVVKQLRAIADAEAKQLDAAKAANRAELERYEKTYAFNADESCCICLDVMDDPLMSPCRHAFCSQCILGVFGRSREPKTCPLCRTDFTRDQLTKPPTQPAVLEESSSAAAAAAASDTPVPASVVFNSKIDALMDRLRALRRSQPGSKALVFSQFTHTINTVAERLIAEGVGSVVFKGNMSLPQRKLALQQFTDDPTCNVLVLSSKASANGLSLTMATDMFLLEPALNPALTQQAISCVHRLGQTKTVRCHHLVMAGSVEERILAATHAEIEAPVLDDDASAAMRNQRASKDSLALRAEDLAAIFE